MPDKSAQVGGYSLVEALADVVSIGILGGFLARFPYWLLSFCWHLLFSTLGPDGVPLTTPRASEDPLKSKSPILMSRGSSRRFVAFATENTGLATRNYPKHFLV